MKNRIIRVSALLLAAVILTASLAGCGRQNSRPPQAAQQNSTPLEQAKANMLDDWFALLTANEQIYSDIFQALEYIGDYAQDRSWDSLLMARSSAGAAVMDLNQMALPALELTQEEISLLMDAGVEINAVQREYEALEAFRATMADTAVLLYETLEHDVFMKAIVEDAIPAMYAFYQEYFTLEHRYLYQFTNYLLLQTGSEDLWSLWAEQLPRLAACADGWYDSTDDLEAATGALLTEMELLQAQMGSFLGIREYTLDIVQEAIDTGDWDALAREINETEGVPGYFPIPVWLPDALRLYLVTDTETGEIRLVQAGEALDGVPSACHISCGAISLADVESYGESLAQWNIETYGTWNESKDTWQLLANSGDSSLLVQWTEGETTLYLSEPVGCLIPQLYLDVMQEYS